MSASPYTTHSDRHAQAIVEAFRKALEPLLAEVSPDHTLHHIQLHKRANFETMQNEYEIRLIIRSIGEVREVRDQPAPPPVGREVTRFRLT